MGKWHSRDVTDFDIVPVVRAAQQVSEQTAGAAATIAREAAYITVGLGVLGFQRAQVRRREIERLFGR